MLGEEAWWAEFTELPFIPQVFRGVMVRALCRSLEFFYSILHGPVWFMHRVIVMLSLSISSKDEKTKTYFTSCMLLNFWSQIGKGTNMGAIVRCWLYDILQPKSEVWCLAHLCLTSV